jgi:hypothetical protein
MEVHHDLKPNGTNKTMGTSTKHKQNGITVFHLTKQITDVKMNQMRKKKVTHTMIHDIIDDDADGYTEDGKLLFVFRKQKLSGKHIDQFYDNTIDFAQSKTTNRTTAGKAMTNIMGYFDIWGPRQKLKFKTDGVKEPLEVRETQFNIDYPENFKQTIPLIQDIDRLYKQYVPKQYADQHRLINQTPFKIPGTVFTTITTNVNFQTRIHTDKGDTPIGFGNLVVIERGSYTGGETCFPQYGIGINVRTGDILFMDSHQYHGNLPIIFKNENSTRLSVVCYLRRKLWERTRGKTRKFMIKHNKTVRKLLGKQ